MVTLQATIRYGLDVLIDMKLLRRHKGMLIGLLIAGLLVVYLMNNPLVTSQDNASLIEKMKLFQIARFVVVVGITVFFWNGVSAWIEARLQIPAHRIRDKRNRILMWYVVIEAVFALGMYS